MICCYFKVRLFVILSTNSLLENRIAFERIDHSFHIILKLKKTKMKWMVEQIAVLFVRQLLSLFSIQFDVWWNVCQTLIKRNVHLKHQ